jgi:choline monooxygenase
LPGHRQERLPAPAFYRSASRYRDEVDRILARGWHLLGDLRGLERVGDCAPFTLLPGSLDEPVLVVRGDEGLRAFANVCTHRGALLVREPGRRRTVVCPYHARCFGLDGGALRAPGFDRLGPEDALPPVALGAWGPLLFASIDPAIPFEDWIADVPSPDALWPGDPLRPSPEGSTDYELAANWKLYIDNYLEGLHIPFVHPGLDAAVDRGSYRVEGRPHGVLQVAMPKAGGPTLEGRAEAALYHFLFPTTMLNLYPWGVSANAVQPRGVDRVAVRFLAWAARPELRAVGAGAGLHTTELEDEAVVESVQRGLGSRLARPGRYAPGAEDGVRRFHALLGAPPG